jgi:hypothetical protein
VYPPCKCDFDDDDPYPDAELGVKQQELRLGQDVSHTVDDLPALHWAKNDCWLLQGFVEPMYQVLGFTGKYDEFVAEKPRSELHHRLQVCMQTRRHATFERTRMSLLSTMSLWKAALDAQLPGIPKLGEFGQVETFYQLLLQEDVVGTVLHETVCYEMLVLKNCTGSACNLQRQKRDPVRSSVSFVRSGLR